MQCLDLGSTDEVVLRQSADIVRIEADQAIAVADFHIRVMVFDMSDPGHSIHKGHRAVEVAEAKILADQVGIVGQRPP